MSEKLFPIMVKGSGLLLIPWSIAEKAYAVYSARYGTRQSLERLAERDGFGDIEMNELYPNWREEASEIYALKAQLDEAAKLFNKILKEGYRYIEAEHMYVDIKNFLDAIKEDQ